MKDDIDDCRDCRLCEGRTMVVRGRGSVKARVVFIGEAPGKDEDLRGEPFVGRAGKVLDAALAEAGASRDDVYITNLVKCRPPDNRRPRKDEIDRCRRHLVRELDELRPSIVCVLGRTAASDLLGIRGAMADIIGKEMELAVGAKRLTGIVNYHPAACLYQRRNMSAFRRVVAESLEASRSR